jgi:hypothetical protein
MDSLDSTALPAALCDFHELGILPAASLTTAWIPQSDGKALHQPPTNPDSDARHQTSRKGNGLFQWHVFSVGIGRPRYVGLDFMGWQRLECPESTSHCYYAVYNAFKQYGVFNADIERA